MSDWEDVVLTVLQSFLVQVVMFRNQEYAVLSSDCILGSLTLFCKWSLGGVRHFIYPRAMFVFPTWAYQAFNSFVVSEMVPDLLRKCETLIRHNRCVGNVSTTSRLGRMRGAVLVGLLNTSYYRLFTSLTWIFPRRPAEARQGRPTGAADCTDLYDIQQTRAA